MAGLKSKSFESETLLNFTAVDTCSNHVSFLIPVLNTGKGHKLLFPFFKIGFVSIFLLKRLDVLFPKLSSAFHFGGLMAPSWCTSNISDGLIGNTSDLSFVAAMNLCPSFLEQDDPQLRSVSLREDSCVVHGRDLVVDDNHFLLTVLGHHDTVDAFF